MPHHYRKPRDDVSIYDLLATNKLSQITLAQLLSSSENSFVQGQNIEFWKGPITLARILESTRTYAHGLAIPEQSSISTVTVEDSAVGVVAPTGTQIWLLQGIDLDNCVAGLFDGTSFVTIDTSSPLGWPIYLTKTLYIAFSNTSGGQQTPSIAYHTVGQ
jgi:hypothetical protein